jgi:hypothetical protein
MVFINGTGSGLCHLPLRSIVLRHCGALPVRILRERGTTGAIGLRSAQNNGHQEESEKWRSNPEGTAHIG